MSKYIKQLGTIDRNLIKDEVISLANKDSSETIKSGKFDILKVYVELKRYETYLKEIIQNLKSTALELAQKEDKYSFQYNNAKIRIYKRTKWDYSIDEEWNKITEQIIQLKDQKKQREILLVNSSAKGKFLDRETGELIEDFKLPFKAEKGISVTLKIDEA